MRVEFVNLDTFRDEAAALLRVSWPPPCLSYTGDYLRWQFGYPGATPAVGVAAFDDDGQAIGFAATVPRRLRLRGETVAVRLLSFVAVRPDRRGRGVGRALYRTLLESGDGAHGPIVAFAQPETDGSRLLRAALEEAGYREHSLGVCRAHGALGGMGQPPGSPLQASDADPAELAELIAACPDGEVLRLDPTANQWAHYGDDPRQRAVVLVRDAGGRPLAAAALARTETLAPGGKDHLAMVLNVSLSVPCVDALRALLRAAGERWSSTVTRPLVMMPNPSGLDPSLLKSAGLRATASSSSFEGHLFLPSHEGRLRVARTTNLEVV